MRIHRIDFVPCLFYIATMFPVCKRSGCGVSLRLGLPLKGGRVYKAGGCRHTLNALRSSARHAPRFLIGACLMLASIHNSVFRDNIEGNRLIEMPDRVRRVVDTREFQRLRSIRQMGLSSYVFPTAEHSRFAHSLGVFATASQVFRLLQQRAAPLDLQTPGLRFDDEAMAEFGIAALCHDLGHSAFSHVLETILLPDGIRNHEDCTVAILSADTPVASAVNDAADIDAVKNLLKKRHANKALVELISSTFDVDRCDYILRDSRMAGVEYGKYDLKWLFHAITVETNDFGLPILLLDGPRGLDALRQFLAARRYLHRQVYFHPTIRGAQLLLKGIFARMQDIPEHPDSVRLAPKCLHSIASGQKPSLDDFIQTTDVEIAYMIRSFASDHSDEVLRLLADMFVRRQFPKAVLDSAKSNKPLSQRYRMSDEPFSEAERQGVLMEEFLPADLLSVTDDLREYVRGRFQNNQLPEDAATYLVAFDQVTFNSAPPSDLLFSFQGNAVPLERIDPTCVGFNIENLLETFSVNRVYVPRDFVAESREYVEKKYRI
ncbi:hypothetical protein C7U89_21105 [Bradyrhizobium sp. WBOS4]|nr:hypothetical protein [Bradyrhizobium sp. WBOS8]MDD1585417.1 hypothetical protein [Bradyrhizobium sp. WBOS4]UUO48672.1 hypothetical protein DCM78_18235 [Bradyrhizobium sp. WBOS04]UUO62492.1 hypothetical protein DCM80_27105 [Bradyrhizobium sp. WBOS08]